MNATRFLLSAVLVLQSVAWSQMSGTYSVHPLLPPSGTNFTTLGSAISALQTLGMSGPVTLQVFDDGGPWNEANPVTTIINPGTAVISIQGNLIVGLSAANPLTIEPFPGESPVLDATGQNFGIQMVTCQYTTIRGFEVLGATVDGISCYADGASGAVGALLGNAFTGNRIHDIGGCGINIYANLGGTAWFDGTIVRNNFLWRCQVTHTGMNTTWRNGYLNERRSRNAIIENNTFFADTGVGPTFGVIATFYAPGIGGPAASLRNNLLVKTVANGALYQHTDAGSLPLVMDTNLYEDTSGGTFMAGASGAFGDLLAFQTANPSLDPSSFVGFAGLANAAGGDLHILPTSSALDLGTPILAVTDDIDLESRPQGVGFDIGADEYTAGTGLVISVAQLGGPGTPISILNFNLIPGNEYYNIFSLDLCPGGPGTGPAAFLGGCVSTPGNLTFVTNQLMAPVGSPPFHVIAPSANPAWGPFTVPPLTADAICIELVGGVIVRSSPVVRVTAQ